MAFRVFLSYSLDPSDQALAWRLQTLAAAHGIEMYVPQYGATSLSRAATLMIQNAIDRSDCVLAIITARANSNVQNELRYALAKQKLVIPIVHSDFAKHPLLAKFHPVFTFSERDDPGKAETKIVEFLKGQQQLSAEKQRALGALAALGLGLLVLFALSEK
jgi:nucleoside 2-deoxyribosyltransferase